MTWDFSRTLAVRTLLIFFVEVRVDGNDTLLSDPDLLEEFSAFIPGYGAYGPLKLALAGPFPGEFAIQYLW
jgi:hypothetical protein